MKGDLVAWFVLVLIDLSVPGLISLVADGRLLPVPSWGLFSVGTHPWCLALFLLGH